MVILHWLWLKTILTLITTTKHHTLSHHHGKFSCKPINSHVNLTVHMKSQITYNSPYYKSLIWINNLNLTVLFSKQSITSYIGSNHLNLTVLLSKQSITSPTNVPHCCLLSPNSYQIFFPHWNFQNFYKKEKKRKEKLSSLCYMPKSLHNRHSAGPISKAQWQIKKKIKFVRSFKKLQF